MTVHVDEIHTDVLPADGRGGQGATPQVPHLGAVLEAWRDACAESDRLRARTAAEGFDD